VKTAFERVEEDADEQKKLDEVRERLVPSRFSGTSGASK
jgi:hypothetical protein